MIRRRTDTRGSARFGLSVRLAMALAVIGTSLGSRMASAADYIYVSMSDDTIVRYDVSLGTSALVQASGSVFVSAAQNLFNPMGLSFDTAGNLYVANFQSYTITRYDPSGNQIGTDFATVDQDVDGPMGLAFDTAGNLYSANYFGGTITRYGPSGTYSGTPFVPLGQGLSSPTAIAFDTAGNLYAANSGNGTITRYDASGNRIGTNFAAAGLNAPYGLAFDKLGNLYAANLGNNTITRYDASGNYIGGTPYLTAAQGLNLPNGLAFDKLGNLYVANGGNRTISKFDSAGVLQFAWSTGSVVPSYLAFVPEPSTYVLATLATGLMALIARRRRVSGKG